MHEDFSIKILPYFAKSKNLMECFAIIGYKEEILVENMPNLLTNQNNLKLSIITSNSPFKEIDYDEIINRIYPNNPRIIKVEKQQENKPNPSSVISSTCINLEKEKRKLFYNCYALKFYEKFIDYNSNTEYYVPKSFLILSEYPFFTTFHKICLNIYNINIEEKEIKKDNKYRKRKINLKSEQYILDNIPIEIFIYCFVNYIPSPINKKLVFNIFSNEDNIIIPKLSAYPYIDFDLCKIINTISINEFIKIYLLTFLEETTFIFSQDLEKLNLLMYTLYILQYPIADTSYFGYIKSFSKENIDKVININSCCAGINNNNLEKDINKIKDLYFVIELEKKKIINRTKAEVDKIEEINSIKNILDSYLNSTKKNTNSAILFNLVSNLKKKLEDINRKAKNNNSKSFFNINDNIHDINIQIQEAFYDFIINILVISNKNYQIDNSCSSIKYIEKDDNNLPEEEKNFFNCFRETDKHNVYYNNFIKTFEPASEEFKLPFLFCDEFTNIRRYDSQNKIPNSISYFKVMETFFSIMSKVFEINYNKLFQDFQQNKNKKVIIKNKRTKKNQLFYLDKKVINAFLYYKNNKSSYFTFLKALEKMKINIESVNKNSLYLTIQNNCNRIVNSNYFVRASIVYIFSIVFPFFISERINTFLPSILENIEKMQFFQRYYLYIILKSINKYYILNQEKRQYSEFNFEVAKNYCDTIKNYLIRKNILPNEEIFLFLKKMLNDNNNNNIINRNQNNENNRNEEDIFILKYDQIEKNVNKIKFNIVEREENSLNFNYYGKNIKNNCLSYIQIFQNSFSIYDDFFSRLNFSVVDLEIDTIIELIVNLIYYLLLPKFKEENLILFLYKTIIVLKKLKKDLNEFKEKHKNVDNNGDNAINK